MPYNMAVKPRAFLIMVFLALAVAAAFSPTWGNGFVDYDDQDYVTANPEVGRGLTADGFLWAFKTGTAANWHPLTWLSHMLDVSLYGLKAGGHHLTSLLIHAFSAVLLFRVLTACTGAAWRSALVAALFALHPLHVESVAWVSERKDVLSGLFWMLVMGAWLRYARRPSAAAYLLTALALAAGLMSKPMAVTLPFVLALLDVWPLDRVPWRRPACAGVAAPAGRLSWGAWIGEKVPLLAMSAASSFVTYAVQKETGAVVSLVKRSLVMRVANALRSYAVYVSQMFWPAGLSVSYPEGMTGWPSWQVLASAVFLAAVSAVALSQWRRRPYLGMGWMWYLGTIVPVAGLVQVGSQAHADRYTYLPLVGLFVALAWYAGDLAAGRPRLGPVLAAAAVGLLLVLSLLTRRQTAYWRDGISLFSRALAVDGNNWEAHTLIGNFLMGEGRDREAVIHYGRSLRLNPTQAVPYNNLGSISLREGRTAEAMALFEKALLANPRYAEARYNKGLVLAGSGRADEAVAQFVEAVRLKPDYPAALFNLGVMLAGLGRHEDAAARLRRAADLDPEDVEARYYLARELAALGRYGEARRELGEVLRLRPEDAAAARALEEIRPPPAGTAPAWPGGPPPAGRTGS